MTIQNQDVNKEPTAQEIIEQQIQEQYDNDPREVIASAVEVNRSEPAEDAGGEKKDDLNQQIEQQVQTALIDDPATYKVKVKLEGQEAELPLAEVLAGYQKNEVASRRMTEATRMKQEAEALLNQAKSAKTDTGDQVAEKEQPGDQKEVAKKAMEALLDGDVDSAAEALAQLTAGRGESSTQAVETARIAESVKQQLDKDSALQQFEQDYADVLADPHLAQLTNSNLEAAIQSGEYSTYADVLKAAGDRTRDWLKSIGAAVNQADTTTTPKQDRVALKQGLEQIPRVTASAGSVEEAQESVADVIAQMKAERGGL